MNWLSDYSAYFTAMSLLFLPAPAPGVVLGVTPPAPAPSGYVVKYVGPVAALATMVVCSRSGPNELECEDLGSFMSAVERMKAREAAVEEQKTILKTHWSVWL